MINYAADLDITGAASSQQAARRRSAASSLALPWQQNKPITTPVTDDEKKLANRWVIGAAAQWGLTANARQHPRVTGNLQGRACESHGSARDDLEKAVRTAEMRKTAER